MQKQSLRRKSPARRRPRAARSLGTAGTVGKQVRTMDIKQKLKNPFALVAQGFVVGAILFWATMPIEQDIPPPPQQQAHALPLDGIVA